MSTVRMSIDLSMTSPVVCIHDDKDPLDFNHCKVYSFGTYSRVGKLEGDHNNINIKKQPSWNHDLERFQRVCQWIQAICKLHGVKKAALEDYAYNGKGLVFNIAEMTGLVKMTLFKMNIPITVISITDIKKRFTGNGNAGKGLMYSSFVNMTGVKLDEVLGMNQHLNKQKDLDKLNDTPFEFKPIDDIVDSYAVLCCHPDFEEINDV